MASAAEQLAANINFSAFGEGRGPEEAHLVHARCADRLPPGNLHSRCLALIRSSWPASLQQNSTGILGWVNGLAGGALGRMAIFALNIMPYISASIIIQLMTTVSPHLEQLKKEGEQGRKKMNQYTRYGTVLLAALQAYGIAVGLEGQGGAGAPTRAGSSASDGHHADRRHRVPDVARRADHLARHRQRHLAHHLRRHRGGVAVRRSRPCSSLGAPGRCRPSSFSASS